jgi:Ca2+-binding RTX toxin-like protein
MMMVDGRGAEQARLAAASGDAQSGYFQQEGPAISVTASQDGFLEMTYLASGRVIMVWTDYDRGLGDGDASIRARLFEADGTPAGDEFRVNASTLRTQQVPEVTALSNGGFVIVWHDFSGQGGDSNQSVKAQIYSAAGTPLGGELLVNTVVAGSQSAPAVAALPDGGFIVAWSDSSRVGGDSSSSAIKSQRFDATGLKIGAEALANTTTPGSQTDPTVAAQADGRFMIVWLDLGTAISSSNYEVCGQLFNADGTKAGAELMLSSAAVFNETYPSVTALAGGNYLVVWDIAYNSERIVGQLVDAEGRKIGDQLLLGEGAQWGPRVEALPSGGFVLSWIATAVDPAGIPILAAEAQIFDAAGIAQGGVFSLRTGGEAALSYGGSPVIAVDADGGLMAAWSNPAGGFDARRYAPGNGDVGTIDLTTRLVGEALAENAVVGRLWNDGVANSEVVYTLEGDTSGGGFALVGNVLLFDDSSRIDHERQPFVSVTVRASGANGSSTVETFTIEIGDSTFEENWGGSAQLTVNSETLGAQTDSAVTALKGGGFLVTWTDTLVPYGENNVKGQLYDAAAARVGGEFLINTVTAGFQYSVLAAGLESGGFVVTWYDGGADSYAGGVKAQLFSAAGRRIGEEIVVNTATAGNQTPTGITGLAGGGFLIVWNDASLSGGDAAGTGIKGQIFDAFGAKSGGEFLLNTATAGDQSAAVVAALPDGGFVAAWTDASKTAPDLSSTAVRAQRFDASGAKVGAEFIVNTFTEGGQAKPAVTVLESGRFVIAWEDPSAHDGDRDGSSVRAQLFDIDGSRLGGEMLVNESVSQDQSDAAVTALPNGGFLIVWHSESGSYSLPELNIMGQYYDADGRRVGGEFRVNGDEGLEQRHPSVAVLESGAFVVSWTEEAFNQPAEVQARLFTPGTAPRTLGTEGSDAMTGTAGDDILYAGGGSDLLRLELGGDDRVHGGLGDDLLYFGGRFDADDRVNGGGGDDVLVLQGAYGPLTFTGLRGIETLRLLSANDASFGAAAAGSFSYRMVVEPSAVLPGAVLTVDAGGLRAGETLNFQGAYSGTAGFVVRGGAGADTITGGAGKDVLVGGLGDDSLYGQGGGDLIEGGEGNDRLSGGGGDQVYGGNGDDHLGSGPGGSSAALASLHGEAGNDRLYFTSNVGDGAAKVAMNGGEGNDTFTILAQSDVAITLHGGNGDDKVIFDLLGGAAVRATLGAGRDEISFMALDRLFTRVTGGTITITDFEVGPAGERILLSGLLRNLESPHWNFDRNPFASGYARLLQDGADTLLQLDLNGGGNGFVTLLRFENRAVASFTPENLDGYVNGTGAAGRILTAPPTTGFDWEGTDGNDTMTGTVGRDSMYGRAGNDSLSGGDGDDTLSGSLGADQLDGGAGNDYIDTSDGGDLIRGGDGDDRLYANGPGTRVEGGSGADALYLSNYSGQSSGSTSADAGEGDDLITVHTLVPLDLTIDAGSGADRVVVTNLAGSARMSLGTGQDVVVLGYVYSATAPSTIAPGALVITDFAAGALGDRIELDPYLARNLPGRAAGTNPFATGHLRLVQSGADTLIEILGASGGYTILLRIESVTAANLTAFNLGGHSPGTIHGTAGNDRLDGGAGNDALDGGTGDDTMRGGVGDDLYVVDSAGDVVGETAGEGTDTVRTTVGSRLDFGRMYVLPANVENLTGTSAAGQGVYANALDNLVTMGDGADLIVLHDGGDDGVKAGGGDDFIYYGNAFGPGDSTDGGAGYDTVGLLGAYSVTFDTGDLADVEKLALYSSGTSPANGVNSYAVTMADGAVAQGANLFVAAGSLRADESLMFDGSAERDGSFQILGGAAADRITGGAGKDVIYGGAGGDDLDGSAGNDRLIGGSGADTLTGGAGKDLFRFESLGDSSSATGIDVITDFKSGLPGERIDLSAIDADSLASGNQAFSFIGVDAAFTAAGQLRVRQDDGAWFVEGDTNGDGTADLVIRIGNGSDIPIWGSSDFLL